AIALRWLGRHRQPVRARATPPPRTWEAADRGGCRVASPRARRSPHRLRIAGRTDHCRLLRRQWIRGADTDKARVVTGAVLTAHSGHWPPISPSTKSPSTALRRESGAAIHGHEH